MTWSTAGSSWPALPSHIARTRSGAVPATRVRVPERSRRQREGQRDFRGGDGQRLGEQMRQMRDGGRGGVVFVGLGRYHQRAAVQRHRHHQGPHLGVHVIVHAEHPRGPDEQSGVAGGPTRVRGARHRVTADEAFLQPGCDDLVEHRRLDAGDVGQRTARGQFADAGEHACQRRHRHGQHDQSAGVGGAGERLRPDRWWRRSRRRRPPARPRPIGCSRTLHGRPPSTARIIEPPISPSPSTHTGVWETG